MFFLLVQFKRKTLRGRSSKSGHKWLRYELSKFPDCPSNFTTRRIHLVLRGWHTSHAPAALDSGPPLPVPTHCLASNGPTKVGLVDLSSAEFAIGIETQMAVAVLSKLQTSTDTTTPGAVNSGVRSSTQPGLRGEPSIDQSSSAFVLGATANLSRDEIYLL